MSRFIVASLAAVILLFFVEQFEAQTATDAPRTVVPAGPKADRIQPQGPTGPLNTTSGGAPAESPQGETPPGMQSAPQGSGASTRTGPSGQLEGTRK